MSARIQTEPFDLATELKGFGAGAGAVVTFSGLVRDDTGQMQALEIEHYPGMTERALSDYGTVAARRFDLTNWRIIHRHGRLAVGAPIMMVATAAPYHCARASSSLALASTQRAVPSRPISRFQKGARDFSLSIR